MSEKVRCFGNDGTLMASYHDDEWGVPVYDDRELFEKLILDGFQAGLSWSLILNKRDNFRAAFDGFDPVRIAAYDDGDRERLLADEGIVRNRLKINATITNAQAYLDLVEHEGSFSDYLWAFTEGKILKGPPANSWQEVGDSNAESDAMSKGLKENGFKFVGAKICYAFMQAVGMIDDHLVTCWRYQPK